MYNNSHASSTPIDLYEIPHIFYTRIIHTHCLIYYCACFVFISFIDKLCYNFISPVHFLFLFNDVNGSIIIMSWIRFLNEPELIFFFLAHS